MQKIYNDMQDIYNDDSCGPQTWEGWITFKNSNEWLVRDEYNGSEWWEWVSKPSLKDFE